MANIFENSFKNQKIIDDTEEIKCFIETTQTNFTFTEYVITVQRGPLKENSWKILKRYNDFAELYKLLQCSGFKLSLPPKKFIGNMKPEFIAQRRKELQIFLNEILMNPILASSLPTKKFIDPDAYSQSFHDNAVQNASLCLRSDGVFTIGQSLGLIGWRLRKHYFKVTQKPPDKSNSKHSLVKSSSQSNQSKQSHSTNGNSSTNGNQGNVASSGTPSNTSQELVLTWTEYGPDKYIDEKEVNNIYKSLMSIQHPYIEPILHYSCNENGAAFVRKFYYQGTLKDILCIATPKKTYLQKYGNCKARTTLSIKQIANYGRQILEALKFLHSKGMPFGHLHTGNILIIDDTVRLLDMENFILGVPSFYRPFYVQHSKIHTAETIDVFCFGHVLFEMFMGYPLQESVIRQVADCPEVFKNLLESILSKESCKSSLPTLEQLIEHKFFVEYAPSHEKFSNINRTDAGAKNNFKLSGNTKEIMKNAIQKYELRLQNEQKSVKNQKRLVRVQELMSSEEEKRKSKQKAKLEHKQSKLKQQASLQTQNGPSLALANSGNSSFGTSVCGTSASCSSVYNEPRSPLKKNDSFVTASQETLSSPPSAHSSPSPGGPPPPPPMLPSHVLHSQMTADSVDETEEKDRSALLESIVRFNRGSLRKVKSNDDLN